jgi:hypothetical protein
MGSVSCHDLPHVSHLTFFHAYLVLTFTRNLTEPVRINVLSKGDVCRVWINNLILNNVAGFILI